MVEKTNQSKNIPYFCFVARGWKPSSAGNTFLYDETIAFIMTCSFTLKVANDFRKRTWFMFQCSLIRKVPPFFNKIGETFDPLDKFHYIDETFGRRFQYRKFFDK